MKKDIIETIYEISEEFDVIMKNHIVINKDLNVILFAHYCSSDLFYKHLYKISKEVFQVNNLAKRNLKVCKIVLKKAGYKKIYTKGVFSFYGDLRPLAVKANFGKWGENGLIVNDKYGSNFLISAIFFL